MLSDIAILYDRLEEKKRTLLAKLGTYSDRQLRFQPGPDKWSMLMVLEHIILGEQGVRRSYEELSHNPVRDRLEPGQMFEVVLEVLENDIPVEVPDPAAVPDGRSPLNALAALWEKERKLLYRLLDSVNEETAASVMFSHPAAGPMDAVRTLRLAVAHFDTHLRQINNISVPDEGNGREVKP